MEYGIWNISSHLMCMYIYICVCVCVCIYKYIYIHIYIYIYIYICACIYNIPILKANDEIGTALLNFRQSRLSTVVLASCHLNKGAT